MSWLKRLLYCGIHNSLANVENTQLLGHSPLYYKSFPVLVSSIGFINIPCSSLNKSMYQSLIYRQVRCDHTIQKRKHANHVSFADNQIHLGKKQVTVLNNIALISFKAIFSKENPPKERLFNRNCITHGKPSFCCQLKVDKGPSTRNWT